MAADGSIIIDTKLDSSGFQSGLSKLGSLASSGLKAATAAVGAVSAGLAAAGGYAIKVGSDFEAGMSKVQAISGATGDELTALTEKAKEMGAKTKFSASESAQAFEYMAMAGWKTGDMLDGIEGIMNLAAASGEDLASVSDIVTDSMTAFGLQAKDSAHFADVLAKASSSSNTNVGMMGSTFKYVAPLAGAMKYSIEDTAVAIGLMANAGIKGEQAGTSLRAMLTRLAKPPKQAAEALDALKISAIKSDGSMRPLKDVLAELREKFAGLDDSQKAEYASSIAGTEAMSGLLAIVNASPEDFDKLTESINNANGSAQEMAEVMQDNLQGQITILKSAVEGLGIAVYEGWQEPLKEAAGTGIEYVNQLTDAFKEGGLSGLVAELGNVFADLAVKIAESAPQMIDASVKMLDSFIRGIADNKGKLIKAAGEIVKALADGLVKLLPKQLQAPVKAAVDSMAKSFQSGGLKKAIQTIQNLLTNLGKAVTKLAKTVLPVLTKAIDFLAGNLDKLLPLITAVVAGMKTWSIINTAVTALKKMQEATRLAALALDEFIIKNGAEAVATAASTGAITAKQIAVGLLNGQVSLATAAQWLWNAAMNANPIGIIITAIAALTAGIAIYLATQDTAISNTERLAETNEHLADAYNGVWSASADYIAGISGAGSVLDGFNDSIIVSNERQQELATRMDEVQTQITEIARTAAEERRSLTDAEIARLQDLFSQMEELAAQELAIQEAYQQTVKDIAEDNAANHNMSLEEYLAYSQKLTNTAQETKDKVVEKADEQRMETLALLRAAHEDANGISDEEYNARREDAQEEYSKAVEEANKLCSDTLDIIRKGYEERTAASQKKLDALKEIAAQEEKENELHNQKLEQIQKTYADKFNDSKDTLIKKNQVRIKLMEEEEERHNGVLNELREKAQSQFDETTQKQLGTWLAMYANSELYGGKIEKEDRETVDAIIKIFEQLPPEPRESMSETMDGMLQELENAEPILFSKAEGIANGIIARLSRAMEGAHTVGTETGAEPSSTPHYAIGTRYHPGGAAIVGENGPEIALLPRGTQVLPHSEYLRLTSAVTAEQARFAALPAAAVNYSVPQAGNHTQDNRKTEISIHLEWAGSSPTADAKKLGQELGRELERELRKRGLVSI